MIIFRTVIFIILLACSGFGQQGRHQLRIDDAIGSPSNASIQLETDGNLTVALWVESGDSLRMACSLDGGLSWQSESTVPLPPLEEVEPLSPRLAVAGGTIYVYFATDGGFFTGPPHLAYSFDCGASWTTLDYTPVVGGNAEWGQVHASDDLVTVLIKPVNQAKILAEVSSTGAGGLSAVSMDEVQAPGVTYLEEPVAEYLNGTLHLAIPERPSGSSETPLFYTSCDVIGGGGWTSAIRISPANQNGKRPQIAVGNSRVHFLWSSDAWFNEGVFYRHLDIGGPFGQVMALDTPSTYMNTAPTSLDVDGDRVIMTWNRENGQQSSRDCWVGWSDDGGVSFSFQLLSNRYYYPVRTASSVRGDYLFVTGLIPQPYLMPGEGNFPGFWYSRDDGVTWEGPFILGKNYLYYEDLDMSYANPAWIFSEHGITAAFSGDGGLSHSRRALTSGIAFPFVQGSYVPGSLTLEQIGNPVSQAGSLARWGVSTTRGTQVHPENPTLTLQLGPSAAYNFTTSAPPSPPTTAVIGVDGNASIVLPAFLAPGTYYIQGWVNSGGLHGGGPAGDLLQVTL